MNASRSKRLFSSLSKLGPYLLIELLLPGGTLLALLLWLSQNLRQQPAMIFPITSDCAAAGSIGRNSA